MDSFPALNFGALVAGILRGDPVLGLRPWRGARVTRMKVVGSRTGASSLGPGVFFPN